MCSHCFLCNVTGEFLSATRAIVMERSENEAGQSCIFIFLIFVAVVAINGNRKDKYVVKWALKKFVPNLKVLNRICKIHDIII